MMPTKREHETDYEVVGVSKGTKPGGIVSVRLKPEEMELLVALSEVTGRTLSHTMRLGLRCLGEKPALATGGSALRLRLDTRASEAVTELANEPGGGSDVAHRLVTLIYG